MTIAAEKAYQKKWRSENREKILAYQVGYRAKSDSKAEKKNLPIWELDRTDEYSNDVFATLAREGRSAYCMTRTSEREEYVVTDCGLIDDPAGWEILERLYQAHGPTIILWGRSGHSWLCRYRHEGEWRTLSKPMRRMAGLVAAMKAMNSPDAAP